jgi:predicted enzyme related to lactoylglutathione lyase
MAMPGELVHFDIPVDDVDKAVDFYGAVMGWKIEKYEGPGMGDMAYWMISTNPDKEDAVQGGIGKKAMPEQTLMNYYRADDGLEAFNMRVKDKGGTVMMEKMPVPGWGWFSVCTDPEGNPFAGWVDDKEAK